METHLKHKKIYETLGSISEGKMSFPSGLRITFLEFEKE